MPFPLAHPAAVLPLRRYCPRQFNFPALVIGSLTPDLGYAFGHLHVDWFSHRFWAGSFGFCLPGGLVLVAAFYWLRRPMVRILPAGYQQPMLPLCERRAGSPVRIVVSLLIGAWTHILLDSITHGDGWLVEHLAILRSALPWGHNHELALHDALYAACTFCGVAWLAHSYLQWLDRIGLTLRADSGAGSLTTPEPRNHIGVGRGIDVGPLSLSLSPSKGERVPFRTGEGRPTDSPSFHGSECLSLCWSLLLATSILLVSLVCRGPHHWIGEITGGMAAVMLALGFLVATGRNFGPGTDGGHPLGPKSPAPDQDT